MQAEPRADFGDDICADLEPQAAAQPGPSSKTCDNAATKAPSVKAYFSDESLRHELFIADIIADNTSRSECAPGPYLFDSDSEIEAENKRWHLKSMPNYFLLRLDEETNEESFYIVNHNGFPINCESFKLKQEKNLTLVLIPKVELEVQRSYYLYLILSQGESRTTWIQPLSLVASGAH